MKKALVLLLALSMVFGAFAAEPVANVNVSEFSGNASVTWGVDLDSGKTGFKNSSEAKLKLNLIDKGDKASKGEGIWGEIKIKYDDNLAIEQKIENVNDAEVSNDWKMPKLKVDKALLHFGKNAYVGMKYGDTRVGSYKLDTAIAAEQTKNGDQGDKSYTDGITAGYANDLFSVDVDFRSVPQYTNQYAFAIDGSLKAVDNLTLKAGYAKDFARSSDENITDAIYAAADYKLGLNDTFYIKPQVGYFHKMETSGVDEKKDTVTGNLVAALLFGWGDKKDAKPGVYFLDNDSDKKVIPGISVAIDKQIYKNDKKSEKETISPMTLKVAFFSGEIVENLTAAAYFETKVGDNGTITKGNEDLEKAEGYEFAAGLKYALSAGEGTITPQFGIAMADKVVVSTVKDEKTVDPYNDVSGVIGFNGLADEGEILNIKAGVEFGGYVENTTFSVVYTSKNLKADDSTGTLDFTCKIAL